MQCYATLCQDDSAFSKWFEGGGAMLRGRLAAGWHETWGAARRPDAHSCMCQMVDNHFSPRSEVMYTLLRFTWREFLNVSTSADGSENGGAGRRTLWAFKSTFAVGGAAVRARPVSFYRALLHLSTVSGCLDNGLFPWSYMFERAWVDLFDPSLSAVPGIAARDVPRLCRKAARLNKQQPPARRLETSHAAIDAARGISAIADAAPPAQNPTGHGGVRAGFS